VEYRISKVTIVHHGFVIPKNKCIKKMIRPRKLSQLFSVLGKPSQGDGLAADEHGNIYITEIANNR
jgi:hypothetical protein